MGVDSPREICPISFEVNRSGTSLEARLKQKASCDGIEKAGAEENGGSNTKFCAERRSHDASNILSGGSRKEALSLIARLWSRRGFENEKAIGILAAKN